MASIDPRPARPRPLCHKRRPPNADRPDGAGARRRPRSAGTFPEQFQIEPVQGPHHPADVEGERALPEEEIRGRLTTRAGRALDPARLEEDLRAWLERMLEYPSWEKKPEKRAALADYLRRRDLAGLLSSEFFKPEREVAV